jgi:methyl-accepting chemotaxis protein
MFRRLGISQKIYLAFGALVLLIGALSLGGYVGVQSVADVFAQYRLAAHQSLATANIVRDVEELRLALEHYRGQRGPETAEAFNAKLQALSLFNDEATASFGGNETAMQAISSLRDTVNSYGQALAVVVDLDTKRATQVEAMRNSAVVAISQMNELLNTAAGLYDVAKTLEASQSFAHLREMLVYGERYIYTGSDDNFAGLNTEGQAALAISNEILKYPVPDYKPKAEATSKALTDYLALATDLQASTAERSAVEANDLDATGMRVTAELDALQQTIVATQSGLGISGEASSNFTRAVLASLGGAAVLLGIIMAVLISRWLSGTIRQMASDMEKIANGNLDIEVNANTQRHELGMMAKALEVFRTNGLAIRSMDEQKSAQAALDARHRHELEALQREVERVVSAALEGDFTARVGAETVDADVSGFAKSLNDVMITVERGVGETADVLDAFAASDLSRRMNGDFAGAFGRLKVSANAAAENFSSVVRQLQGASRELKMATGEILAGANDLSERTTKQAATIAETSSAIEQLQRAVSENASKTNEVASQTLVASGMADEGGQVMQKATVAMERITQSSTKISDIIGLIDDIAFQTNLLALNASVEAARAGEAGKGFAVVAVEVRRLAQSAAQASADVKGLVEASMTEVRGGSQLVQQAATKLAAILAAVRENSTLVSGISSATQEQATAIGEVTLAIRRMDEMTQHNAALVEETNASIEQTEGQASELDRIADTFTLSEETKLSQAAPARPPKAPPAAAVQYLTQGNAAVSPDWTEF